MILENSKNVSTNITGATKFTVSEDSSKIFSFLSNYLYKDKERSVITELCSNATDSHKLVGKEDIPIRVTLPTKLIPNFIVRDFGPGLGESDIYKFLASYGSSSKGDTNDMIGGFGIGSKSPAAVTNTWNIISCHKGLKTKFLVFIDDSNTPNITKIFTSPTDESGLEVTVPSSDHHSWHQAATRAFEYYTVRPNVAPELHYDNIEYVEQFGGLYKCSDDYHRSGISVLLNNRLYDVDSSKLYLNDLPSRTMLIPFDTASLSVSLSREDLQYDKKTIEAIKDKISQIKDKLVSEWKQTVSPIKDELDYKLAVHAYKEKHVISSYTRFVDIQVANDCRKDLDLYRHNLSFEKPKSVKFKKRQLLSVKNINLNNNGSAFLNATTTMNVNDSNIIITFPIKSVTFVLNDCKHLKPRLNMAQLNGTIRNEVIILCEEEYNQVPNQLHKVKASTIDLDTDGIVKTKVKKVSQGTGVYESSGKRFKELPSGDLNFTKLPFPYAVFTKENTTSSIVGEFDKRFFEVMSSKILFVKDVKDVPENGMTCKEYAESMYKRLSSDTTLTDNILRREYDFLSYHSILKCILRACDGYLGVSKYVDSFIKDYKHLVAEYRYSRGDLVYYEKLSNLLGHDYKCDTLSTIEKEIMEKYPILNCISRYSMDTSTNLILDYMRLVETEKVDK